MKIMQNTTLNKLLLTAITTASLTCLPLQMAHADIFSKISKAVKGAVNDVSNTVDDVASTIDDAIDFLAAANELSEDDLVNYAGEINDYTAFIAQIYASGTFGSNSASYTLVPSTEVSANSGNFNIVTYNIRGFPDVLDGISDSQSQQVGTFLNQYDADIVALQENWVKHDLVIENLSTTQYPYRTNHYAGTKTSMGDGLLTIAKFPFDKRTADREAFDKCYGSIWQVLTAGYFSPDCEADKGFSFTRMVIDNEFELDVYNLHQNTGSFADTNGPNMEQLAAYILEHSIDRPLIIAGDWNSNVELAKRDQWIANLIAATGISFACEDVDQHEDEDYDPETLYKNCNNDVVAYRGNSVFTLTPTQRIQLDDGGQSDHAPIRVTFDWQRNFAAEQVTQVDESWTNINSTCDTSDGHILLAQTITTVGIDPGALRMNANCQIKFQEEASRDNETNHANETVDIINVSTDYFDDAGITAESGSVSVDHITQTIHLTNTYTNPVVFTQAVTFNDGAPALVEVSDVQVNNFDLRIAEFDYLDGIRSHDDTVHYLVIEAGTYDLGNTHIVVGTNTISTTKSNASSPTKDFTQISFTTSFDDYALVAQVQDVTSTTTGVRIQNKYHASFDVELMVQEADSINSDNTHTGTVAYLAVGTLKDLTRLSGDLTQVSVGDDNTIWGLNSNDVIYNWNGSAWQQISGDLVKISAASDGTVWGINSNDAIFYRGSNNWVPVSGALKHISVGNANDVWGVNDDDNVYYWNGAGFTKVSGKLKSVSVGSDGTVWGVNSNNAVYQWNGSGWTSMPGTLKQVSVGNAYNVWGVNTNDQVFFWNGQQWIQVEGTLNQISAGDDGKLCGVNDAMEIYCN